MTDKIVVFSACATAEEAERHARDRAVDVLLAEGLHQRAVERGADPARAEARRHVDARLDRGLVGRLVAEAAARRVADEVRQALAVAEEGLRLVGMMKSMMTGIA